MVAYSRRRCEAPGRQQPAPRRADRRGAPAPSSPSACFPWSLHKALVFITFSLVFEKGITCTFRSVPL